MLFRQVLYNIALFMPASFSYGKIDPALREDSETRLHILVMLPRITRVIKLLITELVLAHKVREENSKDDICQRLSDTVPWPNRKGHVGAI